MLLFKNLTERKESPPITKNPFPSYDTMIN